MYLHKVNVEAQVGLICHCSSETIRILTISNSKASLTGQVFFLHHLHHMLLGVLHRNIHGVCACMRAYVSVVCICMCMASRALKSASGMQIQTFVQPDT